MGSFTDGVPDGSNYTPPLLSLNPKSAGSLGLDSMPNFLRKVAQMKRTVLQSPL